MLTSLSLSIGSKYIPAIYVLNKIDQISIEAAQPKLDLGNLDGLAGKTVIFGVLDMGDPQPETPETVAARIRAVRTPAPRVPAPCIPARPSLARTTLAVAARSSASSASARRPSWVSR